MDLLKAGISNNMAANLNLNNQHNTSRLETNMVENLLMALRKKCTITFDDDLARNGYETISLGKSWEQAFI